VIIGDRLREMREEKKLSQGTLKSGPACCDVTFLGSKMDTRSRPSKHWKNWPVRWRFHFISSSTKVRSLPKLPNLPKRKSSDDIAWGSSGKDGRFS